MKPFYKNIPSTPLQKHKTRAFSLIELLVVFALLAMLGGVLTLNLRKGLSSERYLGHVHELSARLQIAQQLMYVAQMDFEVHVDRTSEGLTCVFKPIQAISAFLQRMLGPLQLTELSELRWRAADGHTLTPPFTLQFFSRGALVSRGELELTSLKLDQSHYILITGDGRAIEASPTSRFNLLEGRLSQTRSNEQLYPEELREWVNRREQGEART